MKRVVIAFLLSFLLLGMLLHFPLVIAENNDSDNNNSSGSGSDNSGSSNDNSNTDEDERDDLRERTEVRVKERNGEVEKEIRVERRTAEGEKIRIERRIRVKDGEIEIRTKLKVEGSGSNFSVVDSKGERHRIRVTPEKLRMLIKERLLAENITNFSIDEIKHKNIPRVVFKVNSEHPGRFLGIFKIAMKAETFVDPETGEVIDVSKPWWAFLIIGEEIADEEEIVGNQTIQKEIVSDDDELEEEFGEIEVEGEIKNETEIKAETLNGSSEVKIEIEFGTNSIEQEQIINEILDRLLDLNVSALLKVEESDEALEEDEKLEVEAEVEDEVTEVEFELRFIVNNDDREAIVSAITTRLSSLTSEEIRNAFELEIGDDEDEFEDEDELEEESEEENEVTINLLKQNNSSESGTATLEEEDGQVVITLDLTGFEEGVSQPSHIHMGSCPDVGGVKYPLTNLLNGKSKTIINTTFAEMENGLPLAINVHKSAEEAGVYVSCGDLEF